MKVKNIMFSGVMAAILGATGAHAAISVASQGYVDSKIQGVETSVENITNNYLTKEAAADTYATTQYVTENVTNILGNETDGLVADVAANKAAIEALDSKYATDTALTEGLAAKADKATTLSGYGITDAYTKTEANALLEAKQNNITLGENLQWTADGKLDTKGIATADGLDALETTVEGHTTTIGEINTTLTTKADKTAVEAITNSLSGYATDEELAAVQATADAAATKTYVDDTFATKTALEGVKATADAAATKTELNAVDAKFANYTTTDDLNTKLNDYATTTALKAEEDARKAADKAATDALANVYTKTEADEAFDAAGSADAVEAKLKLLATAEVPAECQSESNTCVLSMTSDGTFAWTPLTATPTASK